ncbi:MAG: InlB B-repeat-containing protein, partial [Lachnospiraceae bacterium]|nr:InlB B-repeat-containing protein [Lachnospiraceae bacterium]
MRKKDKKLWKALVTCMATVTAFSTLLTFSVTSRAETTTASQGNEYATVSEEEIKDFFTMSEEEEAEYVVEAAAVASNGKAFVDLSESPYFPKILNQNPLGSCQSYAFIYTTASYAINQSKGIASTPENCLNPLATYSWMEVANAQPTGLDTFSLMTQLGVPTIGKWSYFKEGNDKEFDNNKRNVFYTTDDVWLDALNHRVKEYKALPTYGEEDAVISSISDSSLNAMKAKLNEGKLLACATYANSFQYGKVSSETCKGESIITGCYGAEGGHVMVIVGYDDRIWVDINGNGKAEDAEKGAFKVANSYGDGWENNGFIWVSYDAFNKESQVSGVSKQIGGKDRISFMMGDSLRYVELRENDNSGCLCYVTVNTAARRQMKLVLNARNNDTGKISSYTFPVLIENISDNVLGLNINPNGDYAWDGSTSATDANIVIDLDNVISDITPSTLKNYTWTAAVYDSKEDSNPLTVKRLQIKSKGGNTEYTYTAQLDEGGTKLNGNSNVFLLSNVETLSGTSGVDVNGNETNGVYENDILTLGASWCYNLKSFKLNVSNNTCRGGIEYRVYQNGKWTDWASDGELCGNNSYDTNYVQIRLTGGLSERYDVCYKTIVYGGTWSGWTANGEKSGASDRRVEGVKITLIPKDNLMAKLNEDNVSGNLDYGTCSETLTGGSGKDSNGEDTSPEYNDNILKMGATSWYALKWFKLGVQNKSVSGSIQYRAYQNGAWTNWVSDGAVCGDGNNNIQYVEIKLTGDLAEKYDICYKTVVYGGKWYGWAVNGQTAGDGSSNKCVEGLQVQLLKKGSASSLVEAETEAAVSQLGQYTETLSGSADKDNNGNKTEGSYENSAFTLGGTWCYQLNSMKLNVNNKDDVTGSIQYRMYQNNSWTSWAQDGAKCGNENNKTYRLAIRLTDGLAKKYDIYYQTVLYGGFWTDWSKNGEESGLSDSSRHIEGVRIKLVKKGDIVDTNVSRSYTVTFKDYDEKVLSTQTVFKGESAKAPENPTRTGYAFTGWDKDYSKITADTVITAQYERTISVSSYKFSTEKAFVNSSLNLSVTLDGASSNATCKFIAQGGNYKYGQQDKYFTMNTATTGTWTPDMDGTYKIFVDITDAGKIHRSYIGDYTVLKIPTVASHTFSKNSAEVNSKITLKVTLADATSDATCKFMAQGGNYPYGQKDKYFTMDTATTGTWTPDMDGTYKIFVDITEAGRTFRSCICSEYNVVKENKEVEETTTTIYYKGYENPNIHYKIGNGSWTSVPGVKMKANSEVDGYNYAITIDLGTATSLTACFNDGNNNWDSDNGNNYSFGTGYYTYSNKKVTKIAKPEKSLKITNLTASPEGSIVEGQQVVFKTVTEDAQGTLKYKYTATSSNGTTQVLRDYSTYNDLAWLPGSAGKYKITVYVTDGVTTQEKSIDYEVTEFKNVNVSKLESSLGTEFVVGNTTNISVAAKDGHSSAYYYSIKVNGTEILPNTSSTTASWT